MNRILLTLKRPFIWLYRFRHRCGYGVHSPFAFNLITHVIYGTLAASALYLKAGKEGADYTSASDLSELFLESGVPVDFLYLHDYRHPDFVEEVFRICSTRTRGKSVFVIEGIRYTPQMSALWKRMKQDGRAGITFDLYDLGIIFFDKTKIKQDYIVNF